MCKYVLPLLLFFEWRSISLLILLSFPFYLKSLSLLGNNCIILCVFVLAYQRLLLPVKLVFR